ncbi:hypothetical protein DESUT3_37290 [Desulfuromonas versatilis]|uniref:Menaquinol oxidoreductase n=1 Tax=Desulfuromonas versatilis TaxID=2802975 RepID=A0ABM8I0P5_9BACT|nr:menaquinol oxidoreductase [Desulfuromonas versatilis]BCR06660.1 hypothetical protein DESUT3_37290 [Desulfuromonas versatilis]
MTSPGPRTASSPRAGLPGPGERRREIETRIRRLHALANRGLWGLAIFILISIGAQRNFSFIPEISPEIRALLGPSPPIKLISIALAVYAFSALILILSRMMSGSNSYRGWSHLGYLSAFYAFYYYGEALQQNFWAVFAAGITILGLEYYQIWTHCAEALRKEKQLLASLGTPSDA